MWDSITTVIRAEAARLLALAAHDARLASELRAIAEEILAATVPKGATAANSGGEPASDHIVMTERLDSVKSPSPAVLQLRGVRPTEAGRGEVDALIMRCGAKAEAIQAAAEQFRRRKEGYFLATENSPVDREIAEWTQRILDSYYWAASGKDAPADDVTLLEDLGGCLETTAAAMALARGSQTRQGGNAKGQEKVLNLIAESQSALRLAFQRLGISGESLQVDIFEWLKRNAARRQIYLKRYMRADDAAEPARWPERLERIELADSGQLSRRQAAALEQLRGQVASQDAPAGPGENWAAIMATVDEIVDAGLPPSHRAIRELLAPRVDEFPELIDAPRGFRLALREIDRYFATRPTASKESTQAAAIPEVQAAARLLAARSAALIGGQRRREAQESLRKSLGLKDLIWIETKEHQSVSTFEPVIARPDVALVLLAIRWSSHCFGDVKTLCDHYGKPLVRLPGGYSPNQVAAQIVLQSSGQLQV
jgi:hypothetical protein